jgi:hypothetical protein
VTLISLLWSKNYEFQKQQEAAIAEKKRTVYRSLMAPWEKVLAGLKGNKTLADAITPELLASVYGGAFDTVLYGSETVLRKYAGFRAPEKKGRDAIDQWRSFGALLVAMREDVTGQKSDVPEDVVLRTFVNLTPEQLAEIRRREYVSKNPEAQRRVTELGGGKTAAIPEGSKRD